ncbi:MAG TPA: hypothetical protein VEQ61_05220, partial [Thermoleophilaceae bacterium]|nr:hypothetical protein [Thermoleophilaceae bacterium]
GTLEQLVTYGGREVKLEDVLDILGVADAELVLDTAEALADHDAKAGLLCVQRLTDSGRDVMQFMRDLSGHLRHLFVVQTLGEVPDSFAVTAGHTGRLAAQAERMGQAEIVRAVEFLAAAISAVKDGSEPRIQLELAILKATQPAADLSLQALMYRIEQLERRLGAAEAPQGSAAGHTSGGGVTEVAQQPAASARSGAQPQTHASAVPVAGVAVAAQPASPAPSGAGSSSTAASAAAPAQQPAPATAPPGMDVERIAALWPAIADAVGEENGMLGAALRDARPMVIDGERLLVAFPEEAAFSKKKAEGNHDVVQRALRGLTGASLTLAYELRVDAAPAAVAGLSEDELIERLKSELGAEEVFEDDEESD